MQEIALRIRLTSPDRFSFSDYAKQVDAATSVAALVPWLATPNARLTLRGPGADPVRIETSSFGGTTTMVVVLAHTAPAVEAAAAVIAALLDAAQSTLAPASGSDGELSDRLDALDLAAPRARDGAARMVRQLIEDARVEVREGAEGTATAAARALVCLADAKAAVVVERVADASAEILEERRVAFLIPDDGSVTIVPDPSPGPTPVAADADAGVGPGQTPDALPLPSADPDDLRRLEAGRRSDKTQQDDHPSNSDKSEPNGHSKDKKRKGSGKSGKKHKKKRK
ncbi:hypothetical protein [Curtobacterium ammoniigenes]|uniref:hypothetical protein n=1 Tax=Curtobacterium ammoniigenes TaxID=395387 RepID=UPI0008346908|nr:hypothetical protein [Curtobacterium ammoniigenes]